ncbi:MAG: FHA domain-containing protein [Flavobacteriales bacterium]
MQRLNKPHIFAIALRFLIWIFLLSLLPLHAQELTIQSVDSSNWPQLKVNIRHQGKTKLTSDLVKVSKNDKTVDFRMEESKPTALGVTRKAIYIMLETSGNTYGKSIADMRSAVRNYIQELDENDVMNIGFFSSIEVDSMGLQHISEKFQNGKESLKFYLDSKVKQVKDTLLRVDLFRSIREGLDYVVKQTDIPEQKIFIVISTGKNNSSSPVTADACISIAKSAKIPIHTILYQGIDSIVNSSHLKKLSNGTDGVFKRAENDTEILDQLRKIISLPPPNKLFDSYYDIIIDVTELAENDKVLLVLHHNGSKQVISASNPQKASFLSKDYQLYLLISVGILVFVVIIMVLARVFSRKSAPIDKDDIISDTNTDAVLKDSKSLDSESKSSFESAKPMNLAIQAESSMPAAWKNKQVAVLVNNEGRTLTYPIKKGSVLIGRYDTCDITVKEQTLTGKHAKLELRDDGIFLSDLGSTNGTFVNGRKIKTTSLENGDQIRMGNVEMTIRIV